MPRTTCLFEIRPAVNGMTGQRIGHWIYAGRLSLLIQWRRRHPRFPARARVLMGWDNLWVFDTWPRPPSEIH